MKTSEFKVLKATVEGLEKKIENLSMDIIKLKAPLFQSGDIVDIKHLLKDVDRRGEVICELAPDSFGRKYVVKTSDGNDIFYEQYLGKREDHTF